MKKILLLFVFLFTAGLVHAQVEVELATSFSAIKSFFLPSLLASITVLWADASKHWRAGTWDSKIFFQSKIRPFLITTGIGIAIYLLLAYLPMTKVFIEILADSSFAEITAAGIMGMATSIMDGLLKPKPESN